MQWSQAAEVCSSIEKHPQAASAENLPASSVPRLLRGVDNGSQGGRTPLRRRHYLHLPRTCSGCEPGGRGEGANRRWSNVDVARGCRFPAR